MFRPRFVPLLLAATSLYLESCAPTTPDALPTSEELTKTITQIAMYPEVTCDTLRTSFDVEYLQLAANPGEIGLEYEEQFAPTPDGETLRIWYVSTQLDRGIVVIVQGSTGTMECYLFLTQLLAQKGWSVLMFDYRGFGESSGEPNIGAMHIDLSAVLDWATEKTHWETFTLLGVSLGSLPAITVAVEQPELVNGVVLDSPVALGEEIRRFQFRYGDETQTLIDMLPWEMLPEESVVDMRQPLLIFESKLDSITPPASVDLFYERTGGPKELIVFPHLSHASGPYHGTGAYSYYLERFLATLWDQYVPFTVEISESDGAE